MDEYEQTLKAILASNDPAARIYKYFRQLEELNPDHKLLEEMSTPDFIKGENGLPAFKFKFGPWLDDYKGKTIREAIEGYATGLEQAVDEEAKKLI